MRYAIVLYAQPEYVSDYFGGLFVHEPVRFVFRVFHISVWRIRTQWLAGLPLCLKHCAYLAACVFGIKFVKNIDERGHVVFSLVCTIYTVVDSNETNVGIGKHHFRVHTDLQIITSQTAHILYNDRADSALIYQSHEPIPIRPVKGSAAVTIVHKQECVAETVVICVLL